MSKQESGIESEKCDIAVIGAGVVGLAIAERLARDGRQVVVFEAENKPGTHTSSRNSGVIHSGIYYQSGSLKARLSVRGNRMLYGFCQEEGIGHKRLGKLIIATKEEEIVNLRQLEERARQNGVNDLEWLSSSDVEKLEPEVRAVGGLYSPSTGIIDVHGLMNILELKAESNGAVMLLRSRVKKGEAHQDGVVLTVKGPDDPPDEVLFRTVINSAGQRAQEVASSIKGIKRGSIPPAYYAKGHYFKLDGMPPFSHLVYPVPVPGGLGTHFTLGLDKSARFGPDVEWIDSPDDYGFDDSPRREAEFYESIRRYYPNLRDGALKPDYTGIRPKLGPQGTEHDFIIQGPGKNGVPGLYILYGIESPGLTASLAIAEHVKNMVNMKRS